MTMRSRACPVALALLPLLMAACKGGGPARSHVSVLPDHGGVTYHDASGWMITVPPGWHVLPFRTSADGASAAGVLLSNATLPAPSILPSFPIQATGKTLPVTGIALIIAVDNDSRLCRPSAGQASCQRSYATLPLPRPYAGGWNVASQPNPAGPLFSDLWFETGHHKFIATLTIGARVINDSHLTVLAKIVASPRPGRT